MFDFDDVSASSKDEQIRAYSMEKAVDVLGMGSGVSATHYVDAAKLIETYIKTGDTP